MCDYCKTKVKASVPHETIFCPFRASEYCGICCRYGHLTLKCPDRETLANRKALYIEQLLPFSVIEQYNIRTKTPLPQKTNEYEPLSKANLEVLDEDRFIRAMLQNHGKPISGRPKENRVRLIKLGDELGRIVVFRKLHS